MNGNETRISIDVKLTTIRSFDQFKTQSEYTCRNGLQMTFKATDSPLPRHDNVFPFRFRLVAASLAVLTVISFQTYASVSSAVEPNSTPTRTRSLELPVFLPDGSEFRTWEPDEFRFSRTLYVSQRHQNASDANPGTEAKPLKTIGRAAELLQPGERVIVGAGVYREWVCPPRGGTDADHMISYEAAPGAEVIIKGSEILKAKVEQSVPWIPDPVPGTEAQIAATKIRMIRLPRTLFPGYNPFAVCNYPQVDELTYWNLSELFKKPMAKIFLQYRGMMFQVGKRL